jgi:methyl-accepting chemotaxis protein
LPISAKRPWNASAARSQSEKQQAEVQRLEKEAAERQAAEDAERVRVIEALTTGLENLSSGNLAYRINATFAPAYEKLRTEFNSAVGSLSETIDEISSTTEAVRLASSEIGSASDDLSKRTEQQAASLEETAAALDEITSTVKSSSQRAEEASDMVGTAKAGTPKNRRCRQNAISAMERIEESSKQISQIISVIDDIAFQTNLLALNAGVEAARAGEAGKGFAVVAQEVRELAGRSANAAKEIKTLIETSSTQVGTGVTLVNETGTALGEIESQVIKINDHIRSIVTGAREQSTALAEINSASTRWTRRPSRTPRWWKKPMRPRRACPARPSSSKAWCGASRPATPEMAVRLRRRPRPTHLQAGACPRHAHLAPRWPRLSDVEAAAAATAQKEEQWTSSDRPGRHPDMNKAAGEIRRPFCIQSANTCSGSASAWPPHQMPSAFRAAAAFPQRYHVGTIGRRVVGILVGFDKQARHTNRDRGARESVSTNSALAARRTTLPAGLLHRMGGVEDHRRAHCCHDRQRPHVADQRVVTEGGATFGQQHIGIAALGDLGEHVLHVPRRQKLALLDVDDLAGLCRSHQQIGLPAQKRRDLQDVDTSATVAHCSSVWTSVITGRPSSALISANTAWPCRARCRACAERCAVGLVEGRLVDQPDAETGADLLERARDLEGVFTAFHLAGSGDQGDRQVIVEDGHCRA